MKQKLVTFFNSLHFETEILEAVEWDEERCDEVIQMLNEYFLVCEIKDPALIKVELGYIFNEQICNIVDSYIVVLLKEIVTPDEQNEN